MFLFGKEMVTVWSGVPGSGGGSWVPRIPHTEPFGSTSPWAGGCSRLAKVSCRQSWGVRVCVCNQAQVRVKVLSLFGGFAVTPEVPGYTQVSKWFLGLQK